MFSEKSPPEPLLKIKKKETTRITTSDFAKYDATGHLSQLSQCSLVKRTSHMEHKVIMPVQIALPCYGQQMGHMEFFWTSICKMEQLDYSYCIVFAKQLKIWRGEKHDPNCRT